MDNAYVDVQNYALNTKKSLSYYKTVDLIKIIRYNVNAIVTKKPLCMDLTNGDRLELIKHFEILSEEQIINHVKISSLSYDQQLSLAYSYIYTSMYLAMASDSVRPQIPLELLTNKEDSLNKLINHMYATSFPKEN